MDIYLFILVVPWLILKSNGMERNWRVWMWVMVGFDMYGLWAIQQSSAPCKLIYNDAGFGIWDRFFKENLVMIWKMPCVFIVWECFAIVYLWVLVLYVFIWWLNICEGSFHQCNNNWLQCHFFTILIDRSKLLNGHCIWMVVSNFSLNTLHCYNDKDNTWMMTL